MCSLKTLHVVLTPESPMFILFAHASSLSEPGIRNRFVQRMAQVQSPVMVALEGATHHNSAWPLAPEAAAILDIEAFLSRNQDGSIAFPISQSRCIEMAKKLPALSILRCAFIDAAALAACLGAELEVWVESGGIFPCDPVVVMEAREISGLSFEEAAELSRSARSGLDPAFAVPIARYRVPATIIPIGRRPDGTIRHGTRIAAETDASGGPVKAITASSAVSMVSVSGACLPGSVGTAARVFAAVGRASISIRLISQSSSEYSICFCVDAQDEAATMAVIEEDFAVEIAEKSLDPVTVIEDLAILTTIGDGMRRTKGIAGRCFTQLARADVNIIAIAQGSSERSISAVVKKSQVDRGVRLMYQAFFDSTMPIDVVLVGCGNVGSALLAQLATQTERLAGHGVGLRLVAVANSRRMAINRDGLDPADWKIGLQRFGIPLSTNALTALGPELSNPVLVDCTASDTVPGLYPSFMLAGFHVVTPNKRGNSGPMERYLALKRIALNHRRRYLYETTVGAGLPVIENLQNLLHAGDRLESFSGILSGSLSFLFGRLDEGVSFSEAVHEAMAKGFTEPDPRDDLSGKDVARKVLILARESGLSLELDDIALDGLVPSEYLALSKDEFIARMSELDTSFEDSQKKAAAEGKVLRFVGSIEAGKGRVGLQAIGPAHPLFAVKGGENALAFSTRYYSPVPLLLRGYGAGANVTAAGIFADILRTLNWNREE